MAEIFSQQFCTVAPVGLGGRAITGQRLAPCLVKIDCGVLTIVQAPDRAVAQIPTAGLEIVTPPMLRKVGTAVVVRIDGDPVSIAFDSVYPREKAWAARQRGGLGRLRQVFGLGDLTGATQGMRLGRQLTRDFTSALLSAGALDVTAAPA